MPSDASIFYAVLNLPEFPLKEMVTWPVPRLQFNKVETVNHSLVKDELITKFSRIGLALDKVLLWTWNKPATENTYDIHTDGHLESQYVRRFAINWHVDGDSCVEWYTHTGAKPRITYKDKKEYSVTEYDYDVIPPPLARWTGKKPALVNTFQPHQVKVFDTIKPRRTVSIRFLPNIEIIDFMHRFKGNIISINKE